LEVVAPTLRCNLQSHDVVRITLLEFFKIFAILKKHSKLTFFEICTNLEIKTQQNINWKLRVSLMISMGMSEKVVGERKSGMKAKKRENKI
jgi:hypothetical protein